MSRVYKGTTLTVFEFPLKEDIIGQTLVELLYTKPDDTIGTFTPTSINEDPGWVYWKPGVNDLDQDGVWKFQPKITFPTGVVYGETKEYQIYDPIA